MAQFTKALASDFNTVRNTVSTVLGTGSGTRGYGSPVASSTVSVGQKIAPAEFSSLTTDINACYRHITNANASTLASIVQGQKITWANFVTYQAAATFIDNNRDTNGGAVTNPAASSVVLSAGWGNASGTRQNSRIGSFSWPSAEAMRFFFNQGGNLRLTGSGAATGGSSKSNAFGTLANGVNLAYTVTNYRNGTGSSQSQNTATAPYSTGTPSNITVTFQVAGASSVGFTIVCSDRGSDDGDADGTVVASNVDIDLTFFGAPQNISNTAGITQYIPTVSFGSFWFPAT
jgi:hypothetical protein